MEAVSCPLCCTEHFPSHQSLKTHLLNVLNNLFCPTCNNKFKNILELIIHLDYCLKKKIPCSIDSKKQLCKVMKESNQDGNGQTSEHLSDSILAKALLGEEILEEIHEEKEAETEVENEVHQYFCQMCSVDFKDIEEHLSKFHAGQEVVVEEENVEMESKIEDDSDNAIFIISSPEQNVEDEENEDSDSTTSKTISINRDPISQHNITDKDGRLYTQKFVKIDKFWLHNETKSKEPIIQKFIVENNEVKKASQEEIDQLDDEMSVIEFNQCKDCDLLFTTVEQFHGHKCTALKKPRVQQFDEPELLQMKRCLKSKTKKIAPTPPFNCKVCNTTFSSYKSLRLHRRMHDPIKIQEIDEPDEEVQVKMLFTCVVCDKSYDKQFESIHMSSHNADNGFNCDICNRKFYSQTNLEMHMNAHSNNKKFTCSYCKKPFTTYDALNDHLTNQCQQRAYACQFCGRRFARPHEKVKHERIHTGEKPHVCDICGKAFRVSYCLTLHLRTHSGTRPYECKTCGKRFKSHSVFNHHTLTHSDVRAYKCPFCPKAFKTSVQLAGHKNSHIKPFSCPECNRPFASLYAVRAHMETHKRDNNLKYKCLLCGALYSRAFALRDHLKQQHHHVSAEKPKSIVSLMDKGMGISNSILLKDEDVILGVELADNIEIINNEQE